MKYNNCIQAYLWIFQLSDCLTQEQLTSFIELKHKNYVTLPNGMGMHIRMWSSAWHYEEQIITTGLVSLAPMVANVSFITVYGYYLWWLLK